MLANVKIKNDSGMGHRTELLVDDKPFPFVTCDVSFEVNQINKMRVSCFLKDAVIDSKMDVWIYGVLIGYDNEKRLYEALKEKFEVKK